MEKKGKKKERKTKKQRRSRTTKLTRLTNDRIGTLRLDFSAQSSRCNLLNKA